LTPVEKRALRNKEKKRRKRTRDALDKGVDKYAKITGIGKMKKQKQHALESIVKSGKGVTVVGKKSKDVRNRTGR
jgi:U3 small nucleolar RNA-associated protein MPP10